ncbi:MAG TPA: ABC transporter permease [Ktedonobacterales bacterium]
MRLRSTLRFVLKRSWHHRTILLPVLLGVLAAVTVLCSVPLFSNAAADVGLQATLRTPGPAVNRGFEVRFTTFSLDADTYARATEGTTANIQYFMGKDVANSAPIREGHVSELPGYHPNEFASKTSSLNTTIDLYFQSNMTPQYVQLTEGVFPSDQVTTAPTSQGTAYDVEALISPEWATQFNLKLGDVLDVTDQVEQPTAFLRIHFVGFFKAKNEKDDAWFGDEGLFTGPLAVVTEALPPAPILLNETAFEQAIPALGLGHPIEYVWFYYLNLDAITAVNANDVLGAITALKSRFNLANSGSADTRINYAALTKMDQILDGFLQRLFFVTIATLVTILPGLGLLLLYLALAASALVERSREEVALMKSRGASTWQVLSLSGIEALILCGLALALAPVLAGQVTGLLTSLSFFGGGITQSISVLSLPTFQTYIYAGVGALLCLIALMLPAAISARTSLVALKRLLARPRTLPIWLRLAPGVLLALLGVFGFVEIHQRGAFFTQDPTGALSVDWVAALSPTLLLLGAAGLGLLVLPPLLLILDKLGQRLPSVSVGMSLRQMARRPAAYSRLVLLLSLTISLGIFASLFSGTFVSSFQDRAAYQSGSDLRLVEGEDGAAPPERMAAPLDDHLTLLPGVTDGMNAFRTTGTIPLTNLRFPNVDTLAIDSTKFAKLSYWRDDFADQPLSSLMNLLRKPVSQPDALPAIVDDKLLQDAHFQIGGNVDIQLGLGLNANFIIMGTYHYFPTQNTSDYALVSDVNVLLQTLKHGNPLNHTQANEVWLKLGPNAPQYTAAMVTDHFLHNPQNKQVIVGIQEIYDRTELATSLRNDPLHFSISGALSLDFVVAALLSVIGFVVLFYLIAQRRSFEFGVLRAMGLSLRQLANSLAWEQITLLASAVLLGVSLGLVVSTAVLPALATDDQGHPLLPPFATHINVTSLVELGLFLFACLMAALLATIVIFRRLKLHEVLRLGEE